MSEFCLQRQYTEPTMASSNPPNNNDDDKSAKDDAAFRKDYSKDAAVIEVSWSWKLLRVLILSRISAKFRN
jgi:hypothetical protein